MPIHRDFIGYPYARKTAQVSTSRMIVASLTLSLQILGSQSLKDKRQVVRSLKDRVTGKFNVSMAEVDHQDLWQRSTLGVAVVSPDGKVAREVLEKVKSLVEGDYRLAVLDAVIQFH